MMIAELDSFPTPYPIYRRLEPLVPIRIETSQYIAKTVDQIHEFKQALALRASVFREEYGARLETSKFDVDDFDFTSDLLVILCKHSQQVVGTYRLICSRYSDQFYSQSEFEMSDFLRVPGIKLELGRACVAIAHRRGSVLNLLWRAILQYATRVNARWIFGCSSVQGTQPQIAQDILQALHQNEQICDDFLVQPHPQFRVEIVRARTPTDEPAPALAELPPLFRSYLKAGARVFASPALDLDFQCFDFLTLLDLAHLHPQFENRYRENSV